MQGGGVQGCGEKIGSGSWLEVTEANGDKQVRNIRWNYISK